MSAVVLFENSELIAIDKPAGVPTLPYDESELLDTAAGLAVQSCPNLLRMGLDKDFGALHRLDNGTSGVLVFAKTESVFLNFRALWKTDRVRKIYRALTSLGSGDLPKLPHVLQTPMGHDEKSGKKMRVILDKKDLKKIRGNPQDTWTELLQSSRCTLPGHSSAPGLDWTICIKTGVRHQIRVHLASLGCPIFGDTTYRGLESPRLWLHSRELQIEVAEKKRITIESPLPSEWPKGK